MRKELNPYILFITAHYVGSGFHFLLPGGDLSERAVDIDFEDYVPCAAFRGDGGPGAATDRWMTKQFSKRLDPHRSSVCAP